MALFLDANGQLVVTDTLPQGGSVVSNPPSQNLSDLAAWFRSLDDNTSSWHPANYYNGASEVLNAAGVVVTVSAANRASVFTATDGVLDIQSDLVIHAEVTNLANPVFVWSQNGLENAPENSTNANYVITSANFGNAKSAIVTCTVNGLFADSITIARLEKSTAQAGATYGATPEQAAAIAQAIGDSAQAVIDAQSVLTNIDDMFSDSKLTPVEKKRIKIDWEKIKQEKPKNLEKAQNYSVSTTAYVAAYDALYFYLNGNNNKVTTWADYQSSWQNLDGESWVIWISDDPKWLNTISKTTAIVGQTFRAKFQTYYDEQAKLLKAISDEAGKNAQYEKLAGTPNSDIANATLIPDIEIAQGIAIAAREELDAIASDSIISHAEKRLIRKDWEIALSEHAATSALATGTTENTNYVTKFNALATYLNNGVTWSSGTPSWITDVVLAATTSADISINGATFRAKFSEFYAAKLTLIKKANDIALSNAATAQQAAQNAQNSADASNAILADISNDNLITHAEKQRIRKEWNDLQGEYSAISALATGTTENTNYTTKFAALGTYLNNGVTWTSGIPSWITDAIVTASSSTNITVVGATFRAKFSDVYAAKIALIKKANDIALSNAASAATTSNWSGTSGKPSNIASLSGAEAILNSAVTYYNLPDKPQSRGTWSSSPYYYFGDIVMYNGNGYFCISAHWSNGSTYPSYATWYWAQISQKGATQATELSDYNNIANANVNWDYVRSLYSAYAKPADGATRNIGAFADLSQLNSSNIANYATIGAISTKIMAVLSSISSSGYQFLASLPYLPYSVTYALDLSIYVVCQGATNSFIGISLRDQYGKVLGNTWYSQGQTNSYGVGIHVTGFITVPANTNISVYYYITTLTNIILYNSSDFKHIFRATGINV